MLLCDAAGEGRLGVCVEDGGPSPQGNYNPLPGHPHW